MDKRRKIHPTLVTLGSFSSFQSDFVNLFLSSLYSEAFHNKSSALATIERNFKILNVLPFRPTLGWEKIAGPELSNLIKIGIIIHKGMQKIIRNTDEITSKALFPIS